MNTKSKGMQQSTFADSIAGKPRSAAHNNSFLALTIAFCLVTTSLYQQVTIWILVLGLSAVIMRFLLYLGFYQHVPGTRIVNMIGIVSGVILIVMSQDMTMLSAMINLLIMASALKIMVLHTQKDLLFIFISVLFLAALGLIIHAEFLFTVFYSVLVFILLATLATHFAPSRPVHRSFHKTTWLILQALPIAIILYLLIPHLTPFWQVPAPKQETTGLTDIVKPGTIADLAQSADLALIVSFTDDQIPQFHERYWRALVIDQFDGESWSQSQLQQNYQHTSTPLKPSQYAINKATMNTQIAQYDTVLMANQTQYVPTLNTLINIQGNSNEPNPYRITASNHALNSQLQVFTTNFSAISMLNVNALRPLTDAEIKQYTQLPSLTSVGNPKTQEWVAQLRQKHPTLAQLISAFNAYLITELFTYTLQPPLMTTNMVDQFLFTHKTGFCSHYASAMGYVLRLAGYPTRLVAGYQGGEQVGTSTLMIYQYDAHAWLEVYDPDLGWIRLDPTAVIAPTRISAGLAQALTQHDERLHLDSFSLAQYSHIPGVAQLHDILQQGSVLWHGSFRSFGNADKQALLNGLLKQFRLKQPIWLGLFGLGLIVLCLGGYFIYAYSRRTTLPDHIRWYLKCRELCVNRYIEHAPESVYDIHHYPPEKFLSWVSAYASSPVIQKIQQITLLFIEYEYQSQCSSPNNHQSIRTHYRNLRRLL